MRVVANVNSMVNIVEPQMTVSTPIARLVQSMLADGVDHGAIVRAVEAAETSLRQRLQQAQSEARGMRLPSDWHAPERYVAYARSSWHVIVTASRSRQKNSRTIGSRKNRRRSNEARLGGDLA